jgi:hypothetical protein
VIIWFDIIEVVVGHHVGFPSRGVVQSMRSRVAPMPVESNSASLALVPESANRSLVTFSAVHSASCFASATAMDDAAAVSSSVFAFGTIYGFGCGPEQRSRRVDVNLQFAESANNERIFRRALEVSVEVVAGPSTRPQSAVPTAGHSRANARPRDRPISLQPKTPGMDCTSRR